MSDQPFFLRPKQQQYLTILQYIVFGSLLLYVARTVLVPIAYSVLLALVLYPVCAWFERRGWSRSAAIFAGVSMVTVLLLVLIGLLVWQATKFGTEWPALKQRVITSIGDFSDVLTGFGVTTEQQGRYMTRITDSIAERLWTLIRGALSFSATSAIMAVLIPVYTSLLLYHRKLWLSVLNHVFPSVGEKRLREVLMLTITTYYNFIKGMGIVYLAVGTLNTIGLLLLGVPHAALFGFLTSVLTIIPYIGIVIGSLLPVTMAWAAHESIWYPLGVVAIFGFVQYLEANIIFPFAVSARLKVNTLVVLVAIFVGGLLWGVSGMILFVPAVGILKLIADQSPNMKVVALLLGASAEEKDKSGLSTLG